jgi:transcriptional antiterminator NusG
MHYFSGEQWYAMRVKTNYEHIVEKALQYKQLSPLYLTYQEISKRKDRKKVLTKAFFPGYMFIKTELDAHLHVEILKSIGVTSVLQSSQGPIPIPEQQIQNILKLKDYEGIIVTPQFATGCLVKVVDGPLTGLIGRINEIDDKLIQVSIASLPGSVRVHVSPELLEIIEEVVC